MTKRRAIRTAILSCLLTLWAAGEASAQQFDIGSGGLPTITGAVGGSVTGSADVTQNLTVIINFGEVSPLNTNNIIRAVVPVLVRSTAPYRVEVSVTASSFNTGSPQAVQRSDIGFGVANLRPNARAQDCNQSPHVFYPPFNNDPATTITFDPQGRAAYPSSLASIGASTVIMSGPQLTKPGNFNQRDGSGYIFDAIFTIKPQYYASGTFSATITFTIAAGPNVPC